LLCVDDVAIIATTHRLPPPTAAARVIMNQLARAFFQPREQRGDAPLAHHRRAPLFAAISTGGAAAPPPAPKLRKEPRTGLEFPLEYCSRGREGCAQLEGVGVRAKRCVRERACRALTDTRRVAARTPALLTPLL
jgi:hypothetical protein